MREIGKSSHLSRESQDAWIITENERTECGKGTNAEWYIVKLIPGQIEGADGWSNDIERQVVELIAGEIENHKAGPLCHIRDVNKLVVGQIELFQTRKLKKTLWDCGQLIVLEINFDNLQHRKY